MVAYDRNTFAQKETALDALPLRFEITVLSKAVRVVSPAAGDGEAALGQTGEAGGRVE